MTQYHKIENVFNRDIITNKLVEGQYREPIFQYLASLDWIATEKVDGTNIRVMWKDGEISFAGKSDNAQLHKDLVKRLHELFDDKKEVFIEKFGEKNVCLYGEGYGAGIQTGGCYKPTKDFVLFDVWIEGVWLERGNVEGISQLLGIEVVPIVKIAPLTELIDLVKNGFTSHWGEFQPEGLVARPVVELKTRLGERVITKIKRCDFDK